MLRLLITYRYPVLAGLVSSAALFVMQKFPVVWAFLLILGVWCALVILFFRLIEKKIGRKYPYLSLLFTTIAAFVGITSLIEWTALRSFLNVFCGAVILLLLVLPLHETYTVRHEQKPWRRMVMMLWVFDAYALATTLFAVGLLFEKIPFWLLSIAGGAVFGFCTYSILRLYDARSFTNLLLPSAVVSLVMIELILSANFLPFGHLALGLLVTWAWYVIQLFARFHLSPQGILWKKQRWFLAANATLYFFFLFFVVRWI